MKKCFEIKWKYNRFDLTAKGLEKIINSHFNQSIVEVKEINPVNGINFTVNTDYSGITIADGQQGMQRGL